MNDTRLATISRALADAFQRAPAALRRDAVREACGAAVRSAGLATLEVEAALGALRSGAPAADAALAAALRVVATRFDEAYLELAESGLEEDRRAALALFTKARAASALAYSVGGDGEQLHEALYEAAMTTDDPSPLAAMLLALLARGSGGADR